MLILSVIQEALKAMKFHTQKSITFLVVLLTKLFVLMIDLVRPIVVFRGGNAAYEFIKAILKQYEYCKKVMKKSFNKNLIMREEEQLFQKSNSCWICEKLIDNDNEKVGDHCRVTEKFRGTAHQSFNINLQLTKKVLAIFHNLKG